MIKFNQLFRLIYISWVLMRHGLDDLLLSMHLFRPIRYVRYIMPWLWFVKNDTARGDRIRDALEDLGPIFIKFGQILSTRRDLLPDDIADSLKTLQDKVPPFSSHTAHQIIRDAYKQDISEIFKQLDDEPFAAASIAQVYGAVLHDDKKVIVKVLRPKIGRIIRRDIDIMYTIAYLTERYWKPGKRLRPKEVVHEFEKTIFDELDLVREAANASQLRRNFLNSKQLYVPEIIWPYTRETVMVMERISGIPVGDLDTLREHNIDMKLLGEQGVEIFFTQVFRDNFFHADMHPGNIFVAPNGQYIAVDFGIVGTLNTSDKHYLAENLLAFFNRDYRRVAELHVASGWVPETTRIDEFESAIRTVCEPIFEKPLRDISFGHFLLRLFQTARRFDMEVQPQLVLLQKTLLNIEGLGRQLYPDLDLWTTAKPFLENWMKEQVGYKSLIKGLKEEAPSWSQMLPEVPRLMHEFLDKAGKSSDSQDTKRHKALQKAITEGNQRTVGAIIGGVMFISGILVLNVEPTKYTMYSNIPVASLALLALGSLLLFRALKR